MDKAITTESPLDRIDARAKALGMPRKTLCKAAGIAPNVLAQAASKARRHGGAVTLTIATLQALAGPLQCTVAELLGEAPSEARASDTAPPIETGLVALPLRQLIGSEQNPRKTIEPEALEELARSIAANGLLQNLVVRPYEALGPGKGWTKIVKDGAPLYEIVAGHRRAAALHLLAERGEWDRAQANIPCKLVAGDAAPALAMAIIENLQRVDISPLEEAEAFAELQRLAPKDWTTAAIADRIGKTPRHVQLRLALVNKLAEPVKEALRAGTIDLAHARTLTTAPAALQMQMLPKVAGRHYGYQTADDLRDSMERAMPRVEDAIFPLPRYDGPYLEPSAPNRPRRFADPARFLVLQRAAVEAKLAELQGEWAWARMFEGPHHEARTWQYDRSDDRTIAGALLLLEPDGRVHVFTGLVERGADADAAEPAVEAGQALPCCEAGAARAEATAEIATSLCRVVAEDVSFRLALALLILSLLSTGDDPGPLDIWTEDTDLPTPLRPSATWRDRLPFTILSDRDDPEDPDFAAAGGALHLRPDADQAAAFAVLLALPRQDLLALLADLVAERLAIRAYARQLHPALAAAAVEAGIAIPPALQPATAPDPDAAP